MDTAQAKMFVCSLNNSATKILVAFIMARSALDVQELREWTGMKRETIYDGLDTLKTRGMVEKQTLAHGRAVWLPAGDFLPGFFQMSEKGTPELQMSRKRTPALVGGGESINLDSNTDSPNIPKDQMSKKRTPDTQTENSGYPSITKILQHTELLFDGSVVMSKGLEDCNPQEALAWCAYAYYQFKRERLHAPGGLVRRRLLDGEHASEKMRAGWREILPDEFLEAVGGLVAHSCQVVGCDQVFDRRADLEEHVKVAHPLPYVCEFCMERFVSRDTLQAHIKEDHTTEETGLMAIDPSVTPEIEKAWEALLGVLQLEMPRASFDTWARDTRPIRYDGNTLTIGVRNTYAQDWLANRLTSTVQKLLIRILNKTVTVQFMVSNAGVES